MNEEQAKKFLETQRVILRKVSVTETICIVLASLVALGFLGIVAAVLCL